MRVLSKQNQYTLFTEAGKQKGLLTYKNKTLLDGEILLDQQLQLSLSGTGTWSSFFRKGGQKKECATIKISTGGIIRLSFPLLKKKYRFKKSGGWKLRFVLLNKMGEEILALLPTINWQNQSHDFTLQVNDDFKDECSAFLILHTVHCANCSLGMMNGDEVPALINV
jgi:hypothetical protein